MAIGNWQFGRCLAYALAATVLALATSACTSLIDPDAPAPIRPFQEPEFGGEYLLYRPSNYSRNAAWPLIVVCHSGYPDSPAKQIRAWTTLAEDFGFLVAAPTMTRPSRRLFRPGADEMLRAAGGSEARILSTIRHLQSGHSISEDRIFLHGWSSGADAALYTGLRHPDLFRAVAVSHPQCSDAILKEAIANVDPHQPVFVRREVANLWTGKDAARHAEELLKAGVNLTEDRTGEVHEADASPVVDFFLRILRTAPWIKLRVLPGPSRHLLEVQFKLQCSVEPKRIRWNFGDGAESDQPAPVHRYAKQGMYRVSVVVTDPDGRKHTRAAHLSIPDAVIGAAKLRS